MKLIKSMTKKTINLIYSNVYKILPHLTLANLRTILLVNYDKVIVFLIINLGLIALEVILWKSRTSTPDITSIVYNESSSLDLLSYSDVKPKYKWPPDNVSTRLDPKTRTYDMRIHPLVQYQQLPLTSLEKFVIQLEQRFGPLKLKRVQLEKLVWIHHGARLDSWRHYGRMGFELYPQALDLTHIIESVKAGRPVSQTPINDINLNMIHVPRTVCNANNPKSSYDLVVIVKSCAFCFENRRNLRATFMRPELWPSFKIGFVFALGMPMANKSQSYHFDGVHITFETGMWTYNNTKDENSNLKLSMQEIQNEVKTYGDLMVGSFIDTYYNLTLKQMMSFRWATLFCRNRTKLFMYMDDDYVLIPQNLMTLLSQIPDKDKTRLAGGNVCENCLVKRAVPNSLANRYAVSRSEFPWHMYPPYLMGLGYLLGSQVIEDVSIAMAFTRYYRIDDVYLGLILVKLRIPLIHFEGFFSPNDRIEEKQSVCVALKESNKFFDWMTGQFKFSTES